MRGERCSDIIVGMRTRLRLVLATVTVCTVAACQTPAPEAAKKAAPVVTPEKAPEPIAPAAVTAVPGVIGDSAAPGSAGEPSTLDPGGEPTPTPTEANAGAEAEAGAEAGAGVPAGDAAAAAPAVDKTKLFAEVKAKKTSDARAKKALEEAEAGGATARELAEASNARGMMLLGSGEAERATAAFQWSRDKDPSYPDASFNLAKQSAMAGEIPETVKLLQEVHKRGGKTLLKQVGFDPVFEIVKDDPDVQKIAK